MKVNQLLRHEREIRGWSQAKVASELGTDPATVGRWERGLSFPYPYFREKLCILFGKNARELGLVQDDEEPVVKDQSAFVKAPALSHTAPSSPLYDPAVPLPSTIGSGLIGRDELLLQLKQRLCAGGSVALTALNGLPGVGKTSLAIQLAHDEDILSYFHDGILWVGLGPYPHVQGQLSRWGTLLGVSSAEMVNKSIEVWGEAIRSAIGMRRLLLVIDDAWTVEDALAFKVGGPACAYLVTTRFPQIALHFAGDGATVVRELDEANSIALLKRLVPTVIAHETATVHQLVHSVGGLPLALNLMGKYLRVQSHSQQPRRIKAALERLSDVRERLQLSEPYALVERHSSLQADTTLSLRSVIAVSEQMLHEQARLALRALAVFPAKPNSFSEEAAVAVCGQSLETIDVLSDASVLESMGPGRYTLHQTIADYARMRLEDTIAYRRLVTYFVTYIEVHENDYSSLEQENENILAALHAASEHAMAPEYIRCVHAFMPFLLVRGLYTLAAELLQIAQEEATRLADQRAIVRSLLYRGEIAQKQGDYVQSEIFLQEGLRLGRPVDDTVQICDLLISLGLVTLKRGELVRSDTYLQEGLTLARSLQDQTRICTTLRHIGSTASRQGNYAQAKAYLQEGLLLARQLSNHELLAGILSNLGSVMGFQGNFAQEEKYLQEGLPLARQLGHRELTSIILINLGWVAGERGNYTQAELYYQEALLLTRALGHRELISNLLINLGCVASERGDYTQADAYYQEGLLLAREIGHRERICGLLENMGWVAMERGDDQQAQSYLQEGLELAQVAGYRELHSIFLDHLAVLTCFLKDYQRSKSYLQEGLVLALLINSKESICTLLTHSGKLEIELDDYVQAERYLQEGLQLARQIEKPQCICDSLYIWGELYLKRRQIDEAAAIFHDMLANIPEGNLKLTATAHYGLSRTAYMQGNRQEALRYAEDALSFFQSGGHRLAVDVKVWLETLNSSEETSQAN